MPTFTDDQISKWAGDYERELCARQDFIGDRYSIPVFSGVGEYEIPNYVTNIRGVLFLGKALYAKGTRGSILTNDTPFATEGSIPFEYIYNGKGLRVLKFLPTPMEDIAAYSGDLWTVAADAAAVIVEFYRTPVLSDPFRRLPEWVRRYVIKDYVCWKAFAAEGPAQDLRAAKYYEGRLAAQGMYLEEIRSNQHMANQYVLSDKSNLARRRPGPLQYPSNFGTRCNW